MVGLTALALATASGGAAAPSFAAKANAICAGYYKQLNRIPPPAETPRAVALYTQRADVLAAAELARFERLRPPSSAAATYARWLTVTRQELQVAKKIVPAGKKNDLTLVNKLLDEAYALDQRYDALAKKMGMTVCGRSTSTG